MPTYEYECRACTHRFEAFQAMSEAPLSLCPQCGGSVRRVIGGGTGVIFKGSGFYVTDAKKKTEAGKASEPSKAPEPSKTPAPATKKESA
jgi:putative FmdB family regulatory protein